MQILPVHAVRVLGRGRVLGLVLAAALLCAATSAAADPRTDQERVDQEVAEASAVLENATEQARAAATRYASANAALPEAEARVDAARGVVVAAEVRVRTAHREQQQAQRELAAATQRYDQAAGAVVGARDQAGAFAIAAYKGSAVAAFNLLLDARDPGEVVDRLGYVDQVATAQRDALDSLSGARLDARQAENDATVAHDRAERARLAAEAALAEAEAAVAAAEAAVAEVAALVDTRAEALAAAEAERDESLARYDQAEAEAARIAAAVREWEASQDAGDRQAAHGGGGAPLARPTQGWMSSGYGMRFDPFFAVWQLHAGVDIAAPGGAPVYAAAGGTVIRAGWNGGYGNYTCLGHGTHQGQGLSTCYAHQSQILVGDAERVERGELIGRVGTTGASTGNHLHFEVRLDGEPTDPVPFLPGF